MNAKIKVEERYDFKLILDLVEKNSRVLDLGCGDGQLLYLLQKKNNCHGFGVEIDEEAIYKCVEKGISVSHSDLDTGLDDYAAKRFDYVILNESLQQVVHPKKIILEALRVGKKVIVGIPNFCQLQSRVQLFFRGKAPITKDLPFEWFESPNLRFLSLKDFRHFCESHDIKVLFEKGIKENKPVIFRPNLFATTGIYVLQK